MIALASSVFVASLVGSAHCAGMCGGIAAFCGGAGECTGKESARASAAYHVARGASYAVVGAFAGAVGSLLNAGGALVGVQRFAAFAAGAAVALVGVALLLRCAGVPFERAPLPEWTKRALSAVHRAAAALPPRRRALLIGLSTPLLPCGWLWAFAAVAAGSGSPLAGAVVMIGFWLGTVPALAAIGAGIATLPLNRRTTLGALAGCALIAVGIYTAGVRAPRADVIAQRIAQDARQSEARHAATEAHGPAVSDVPEVPACCRGGDQP